MKTMRQRKNVISDVKRLSVILAAFLIMLLSSCAEDNISSGSVDEAEDYKTEASVAEIESSNDAESTEEEMDNTSQDPIESMNEEEYLEYLSNSIPYVGMSEAFIDKTACGKHTDTGEFGRDFGYRWSFDDLHALVVTVRDGEVIEVNPIHEELFWDGEMPHLEVVDGEKKWKPVPGALHKRWEEHEARRDKSVDNFATAEEYADYYHDEFLDVLINEEYYNGDIDEHAALEESYLDAIDYWERHQPWPEPEE